MYMWSNGLKGHEIFYKDVIHSVATEPRLQPLKGEMMTAFCQHQSWLDIHVSGFWNICTRQTFWYKGFHANAPSYSSMEITAKKREYGHQVCKVKHEYLLLFFDYRWKGWEGTAFYKCGLVNLIAQKAGTPMSVLFCHLSFAVLRSSVTCVCDSHCF